MAECEKQTAQRFRMTEASTGMTPEIYILTRGENAGYVSFENDTSILSGVADIFPVFFILIAILVLSLIHISEQRVFFSAADKRRRFAGHVESGRTAERTELYRSGENQRYSIYRRRNVSGYSDGNRC